MAKKKTRLPKRIAGVKLPKPLRRGAGRFLASRQGRALALEALAVTASLVAVGVGGRKAGRRLAASSDGAAGPVGAATSASSAVAYALGEGLRAFTDALHRGKARADAFAAWPPVEPAVGATVEEKAARTEKPPPH